MVDPVTPPAWPEEVFAVLQRGGIEQVAYVPDAGHAHLIQAAGREPGMRAVVLTSEEEGVGLVSGAWLGGQRAVLLMQSSGVGNCVNLFSLLDNCRFPFLSLITMRGEYAEFNPWQSAMGHRTEAVLDLMGITVHRADRADEVAEVVAAALDSAFLAGERVAVLIGQRLIGRKAWVASP
jgi:sulfopyruvate decarboxylase alpha subunit